MRSLSSHVPAYVWVVYQFVSHGRTYPEWFPVFRDARSDDAEVRLGARMRYHVTALLPYHLYWDVTLTRLEPPHVVETDTSVALGGWLRLRGWVRFRLEERQGRVEVINEQEMRAERPLPGPLRALAARVFAFNHAQAMAGGGRGRQHAVSAAVAAQQAAAIR